MPRTLATLRQKLMNTQEYERIPETIDVLLEVLKWLESLDKDVETLSHPAVMSDTPVEACERRCIEAPAK